jgi:hypothetical protein
VRGNGIGKGLLSAACERLVGAGVTSVCLWVFDRNQAAIDYYLHLGGIVDKHGVDPFAGANAAHTRIGWPSLATLRENCAT